MTELAAGYPARRVDGDETLTDIGVAGPVEPASESTSATSTSATSTPSTSTSTTSKPATSAPATESRFGEAVDKVGDVAGDVVEKVGDAAEWAAERAAAATGRIASQVVDRLRNNAELAAERGTTTIADEVVEKIAGIATREVPGVYDLGGDVARIFAAVKERVGLGEASTDNKGVSVTLSGKQAEVRLTIVIEYGFVVYSVTEKVRAKVISAIENLLGLEVTTVDILVDDVHVSDEALAGKLAGQTA